MNCKLKLYFLLLFIINSNFAHLFSNPILVVSVPKAGSHLLLKCVNLITSKEMKNFFEVYRNFNNLSNNFFFFSHLEYIKRHIKLFNRYKFTGLLIIRDPRDQLISLMNYIFEYPALYPKYRNLTRNELINRLINGTNNLYSNFMGWMQEPNFLTVRFEDLIGPYGGGKKRKQIQTILNIAKHINCPISEARAKQISRNLFGETPTFRKGKISSWRKYFTYKQKELFKKKTNNLLIELGYEKDSNW